MNPLSSWWDCSVLLVNHSYLAVIQDFHYTYTVLKLISLQFLNYVHTRILLHAWCYEFHFPADVILAQCVIFSFSFLGFISISLKKKWKPRSAIPSCLFCHFQAKSLHLCPVVSHLYGTDFGWVFFQWCKHLFASEM